MGFQPGNKLGNGGRAKEKLFLEALDMEIKEAPDLRGLRVIARTLLDLAVSGDVPAIKEVANRFDGMPVQQQLIDITEKVTVIRSPEIEASTDTWKRKLLTAPITTSFGNPSQGHKLNS